MMTKTPRAVEIKANILCCLSIATSVKLNKKTKVSTKR